MVRFGICANMIAGDLRQGGVEVANEIKRFGYDYIELSLSDLCRLDAISFESVVETLKSSGLPCESCNNLFPPDLKLTGPERDPVRIRETIDIAMDRAAQLGASVVVFGSGPAKTAPDGYPLHLAMQQVEEVCRWLNPVALQHGITIVIEPLRPQECNLINTVKDGLDLAESLNLPAIALLADSFHMGVQGEDVRVLETCAPFLRHVHLARTVGRRYPSDPADFEHLKPLFEALSRANYQHRISVEAYCGNFTSEGQATLKLLKSLYQTFYLS